MRTCGTCTACCYGPSIVELNKPTFTRCNHLRDDSTGCSVYSQRPRVCRSFKCDWLSDEAMPDAMRPDKWGVLIYNGVFMELTPGALKGHPQDGVVVRRDSAVLYVKGKPQPVRVK